MNNMEELIIIPQVGNTIVARVEDETITEIGKIDIPFNSRSVITKNNLIVSLCFDSNTLKIHTLDGGLLFEKENVNYKAINFKNNIIYLGGEYKKMFSNRNILSKGEMFSVIDLESVDFEINTIDLPIKIIEGKSIDDILINGDELILVDNVRYPKFLIKYDITTPEAPKCTDIISLPNNGSYEHIIKGDINADWMIIYSSSDGWSGDLNHIIISGKTEGHLQASRSMLIDDDLKSEREGERFSYIDIALIKNHLYILRTDGLGYIDLNSEMSDDKFKLIKTKSSNAKRLIKTSSEKLIAIGEHKYEFIFIN